MKPNPTYYVDLERYPIDKVDSAEYQAMLEPIRHELEIKGCAVLDGFIKPDCIEQLIDEADRTSVFAHKSFSRTNAYFSKDDPA